MNSESSMPTNVGSNDQLGLVPEAWMCEFVTACESTETQFVTEDPSGTRWADVGDPSPYRVTPLYTQDQVRAAVAAERERILAALPGGHSVDPRWVADLVRGQA